MASLLLEPFNFVQGDKIKVRVSAHNAIGYSEYSLLSTLVVASVQKVPHKP